MQHSAGRACAVASVAVASRRAQVYSFGIDKDLSFELDLLKELGLRNVFTFDPTPYAKDWITTAQKFHRLPQGLHYEDVALAKIDGKLTMFQYDGTAEHTVHIIPGAVVKSSQTFPAGNNASATQSARIVVLISAGGFFFRWSNTVAQRDCQR